MKLTHQNCDSRFAVARERSPFLVLPIPMEIDRHVPLENDKIAEQNSYETHSTIVHKHLDNFP